MTGKRGPTAKPPRNPWCPQAKTLAQEEFDAYVSNRVNNAMSTPTNRTMTQNRDTTSDKASQVPFKDGKWLNPNTGFYDLDYDPSQAGTAGITGQGNISTGQGNIPGVTGQGNMKGDEHSRR